MSRRYEAPVRVDGHDTTAQIARTGKHRQSPRVRGVAILRACGDRSNRPWPTSADLSVALAKIAPLALDSAADSRARRGTAAYRRQDERPATRVRPSTGHAGAAR